MKFLSKLSLLFILGTVMFTACKKEDPAQEINNYYTSDSDQTPANMKLLKEYGSADSTSKITFSYYNGEKFKLQELIQYSMGIAGLKLVVNYNVSGNPESVQAFSLPSNTLTAQGTYEVDANNNITKVVMRNNTGDTTGIFSYAYVLIGGEYKIASKAEFDPADGKNVYYDYFEYDNKGFMTKIIGYDHSGASLFKSSVTECTPTSIINTLPNILNYTLLLGSNNLEGTACLYFSSYIPSSSRTERFNSTGGLTETDIDEFTNIQSDADKNVTSYNVGGSDIYLKY